MLGNNVPKSAQKLLYQNAAINLSQGNEFIDQHKMRPHTPNVK